VGNRQQELSLLVGQLHARRRTKEQNRKIHSSESALLAVLFDLLLDGLVVGFVGPGWLCLVVTPLALVVRVAVAFQGSQEG